MLNENDTRPEEHPQQLAHLPLTDPTPQPQRPAPLHPDTLIKAGAGLGLLMIVIAIIWVNGFRGENLALQLLPGDSWQLIPGVAIGTVFAGLVWVLGKRLSATREIVALLEATLDLSKIKFHHVVMISLLAAIPEELLFRGAVQASVGVIVASVIFGALHGLTRLYFAYATFAGLVLGALFIIGGSLWMPIGAHFAIDFVMFMLLLQREQHEVS